MGTHRAKSMLLNAALFLGTLLLCFLLLEAAVRVIYGTHLFYEVDEELYWRLAPSQQGYQDPGYPHATINSRGFRGDEVEPGRTNILFIGDSYVFGENVEDDETLPFLLEKGMREEDPSYQLINLGTPAWGLFQMERYLYEHIEELDPQAVILMLNWFSPSRQPFPTEEGRETYLREQRLKNLLRPFASLSFLNYQFQRASGLFLVSSIDNYRDSSEWERYWPQDRVRIERLAATLEEQDIPFYLVIYPDEKYDPERRLQALAREAAENMTLMLIDDFDEAFQGYTHEELRLEEGHPAPHAYELTAGWIQEKVESSLLSSSVRSHQATEE